MPRNRTAILTQGPVGRNLVNLTWPMVFGILGMMTFNLVDTFFVGRLGTRELAALSFTFPVVMVIGSLAQGLGIATTALVSRAIGEKDERMVKRLSTDSLILSLLVVSFFVAAGQLSIEPLFRALGAAPDILPLVMRYMRIWFWGMIFVVVPMVGNGAIRATGDTRTPSAIMLAAVFINLVLDPLLIFGIGPFPRLELAGAALTTVFARATAFGVSLYVLIGRERMLTHHLLPFKELLSSWGKLLYIGLPAAGTRVILPLSLGVLTRIIASFGAPAVAAYGVATRIEFFSLAVLAALAAVIGPFVGQNWGAGQFARVKQGVNLSKRFCLLWGIGLCLLLQLAARPIAALFNADAEVVGGVVLYLRIVPWTMGMQGILLVMVNVMSVLEKPFQGALLIFTQMFVLCLPAAYLGSLWWGLGGVFAAVGAAYALGGSVCHLLTPWIISHGRVGAPIRPGRP